MVRFVTLVLGAIPAIIAILIVIPMITQQEIPFTASNPFDEIDIEYTKHQLKFISFGITNQISSLKTEILVIKNDKTVTYNKIQDGIQYPEKISDITDEQLKKLKAVIKETGFITIPSDSFPIKENVEEYQKSSLKITLNGRTNLIHWPEQNATDKFVPPIITLVETELDLIIEELIE